MVVMSMNTGPKEISTWMPGVAAAGTAALLAWTLHSFVPSVPLLTAAVALGILVGQLPLLVIIHDQKMRYIWRHLLISLSERNWRRESGSIMASST